VTVDKSKDDILVKCTKPGYQDASASIPSDFQGWTLGNLVLGGLIGVGVDAASGAMNEYPGAFGVPMTPIAGYAPAIPSYPGPAEASVSYISGTSGPDLGIRGTTVTPYSTVAVHMNDPHGAFIASVKPDGAAWRAGLQAGDIVMTFNGLRVDTFDALSRIVATTAAGATVTLGVLRQGHLLDVPVRL
jgi:S1-C subfamily serine protease